MKFYSVQKQTVLIIVSIIVIATIFLRSENNAVLTHRQTVGEDVEDVGARMSSRVQRIREVCRHSFPGGRKDDLHGRFFPSSVTVSAEDGLAWCRLGKVGTHAWSALFLLLRGVNPTQIQGIIERLETHSVLKEYYGRKPAEKLKILEENPRIFKFLVVRHPFERLVSAYRDKLERSTRFNEKYRGERLKMVEEKESGRETPSFAEFINYILKTEVWKMDKHWAPYSEVCKPCDVSYNAVVSLETLETDSAWLFHQLNLTQPLLVDWRTAVGRNGAHVGPGGQGTRSTRNLSRTYLDQIPDHVTRQLYNKYKLDFDLFGYSMEEYIKQTQ